MADTEKIQVSDLSFIGYINKDEIQAKVSEIAARLNEDYADKNPMFLVILNGAFIFAADLIRQFNHDCEVNFIRIKSYHNTESTGNVEIFMPHEIPFEGRHIVIVEDIIDTGNTMAAFLPLLQSKNPASVSICAFLVKPEAHMHDIKTEYPGFVIPKKFVLGYGLDYNGLGRNLADLYQLSK